MRPKFFIPYRHVSLLAAGGSIALLLAVVMYVTFPPPPFAYAASISWNGSVSSDWNDEDNWDGGVVPGAGDDVIINDPPIDPVLSGDITVNSLTLTRIIFDANGYSITAPGGISVSGSPNVGWIMELQNANEITGDVTFVQHSLVEATTLNGNAFLNTIGTTHDTAQMDIGTVNGNVTMYYCQDVIVGTSHITGNFIVTGTNSVTDVHVTAATLQVDGNLDFSDGRVYAFTANDLTVGGGLHTTHIDAGTVTVAGNVAVGTTVDGYGSVTIDTLDSGGDISMNAAGGTLGAITADGSVNLQTSATAVVTSVTFAGCDQSFVMGGSLTVGTLSKHTVADCTLTMGSVSVDTLDIGGTAEFPLKLRSGSPGTYWELNTDAQAVSYVDVSDAKSNEIITCTTGCINSGHNSKWLFSTVTWVGATNDWWATATNWDTEVVPLSTSNVVIAPGSYYPVISSALSYEAANVTIQNGASIYVSFGGTLTTSTITIDAGGTLQLGDGATVSGAIENQGIIAVAGGATVTYNDTDSGLCQYSVATSLSNAPVTNCYDLSIMGGTVQANSFTVANDLYIADGAVLDVTNGAMGASLSVGGSTENMGTIRLSDTTTLTGFSDTDSGLCDYIYGNGGGGGLSYFSECHNVQWIAGGSMTMQLYANETIAGNLTVDGGNHIACNTPGVTLDVANDVTVSGGGSINCSSVTIGGSLAVSNASLGSGMETNVTVAGDVTLASANTSNASLTLNGCNQSVIGDGSWLYFSKTEASDDAASCTLTLGGGSTIDILNGLTLGGLDEDDRLLVVSDTPSTPAIFDMQNASTWSNGEYLTITDNTIVDNSSSIDLPLEPANSLNGGNTVGWFVADDDGDGISNDTEGSDDVDGDSIPNYLDPDSDGDGFSDADEYSVNSGDPLTGCTTGTSICEDNDIDDDATPNYLDTDSDADGVNDSDEYSAAAEDPLVSCTE